MKALVGCLSWDIQVDGDWSPSPEATVMTDFAGLCCTTCMPLGSGCEGFYDAVGPICKYIILY